MKSIGGQQAAPAKDPSAVRKPNGSGFQNFPWVALNRWIILGSRLLVTPIASDLQSGSPPVWTLDALRYHRLA
jgi:hypothetical protein